MKRVLITLGLMTLTAGCASHRNSGTGASGGVAETAVGTDSGTVAPQEARFARQACQVDVAEAEIAKLASRNTKNEEVRIFARKVVKDRTEAEQELARIFEQKGIRPEPVLARNLQSTLNHLARLRGRAFDEAFKQQVIEDQQTAIRMFQEQVQVGVDPDLKAFAEKHLPQLRAQLLMAEQLDLKTREAESEKDSDAGAVNRTLRSPGNLPANIPR